MDIVFKCSHCRQELEVDAGAAGQSITCPACAKVITIPEADPTNIRVPHTGHAGKAGAKEAKTRAVPVSDKPVECLIKKPLPTLEVAAKDSPRMVRIKTLRHSDCREVGHDKFDQVASEVLQKIGEENIVSVNTINYSYIELGTQKLLNDFGLLIIYKG